MPTPRPPSTRTTSLFRRRCETRPTAAGRIVALLAITFAGCHSTTPTDPVLPPGDARCAGVRSPVTAIVLAGGSLLIPPDPEPVLEQLARDLASRYKGTWETAFSQRFNRDVDLLTAQVESLLRNDPSREVLLIGHSSGGADADTVARRLASYGQRIWLITIDPVEDALVLGSVELRSSPLAASGPTRHLHIMQPNPGPTLPGTTLQLGIKIDYAPGTSRRRDLASDHYAIKSAAIPFVFEELETRFGACRI